MPMVATLLGKGDSSIIVAKREEVNKKENKNDKNVFNI
jgi:hypothetical protein